MSNNNECKTIRYFAEAFIRKELSDNLHNEILNHLATCDECFSYYIKKAQQMGDKLIEARKARGIVVDDRTEKQQEECVKNTSIKIPYESWTDACKVTDLTILMQAKAVRDSVHERYNVGIDEEEIFRDFGLFIMKKICQKIDHLEKCLTLEINTRARTKKRSKRNCKKNNKEEK